MYIYIIYSYNNYYYNYKVKNYGIYLNLYLKFFFLSLTILIRSFSTLLFELIFLKV